MGFLDKAFKNVVRGARDFVKGPGGILALSAAAPFLAPTLGAKFGATGLGAKLLGSKAAPTILGKALASPYIKNALTNAAIQGGIASLTRSRHPFKAMAYSALASMPFSYMQAAQASKAFNLANPDNKVSTLDMLLGGDKTIPGKVSYTDIMGERMIPDPNFVPNPNASVLEEIPMIKETFPTPHFAMTKAPDRVINLADEMGNYFLNPGQAEMMAANTGVGGLASLFGDVNLMATAIPQIAGMYGGRMTDAERFEAFKEKQIRMYAFQFGIPYEEAKEIFKDGYRNPYYTTQTPTDYGPIQYANMGGEIYKDDYTAGGKAVGPGGPKEDKIRPVALSDEEFVFTAEAANNFPGKHKGLYAVMNALDPDSEKPEEARERV
tara:strand:- start:1069 stop:2208 length:1140 start_codon:yes stop_codon:yes gene_type:complete